MTLSRHVAIWFVLLFTFFGPILFLIYLSLKKPKFLRAFMTGLLTFFIFQILTRLQILRFLTTQEWFISYAQSNPISYPLILSFSAGLFEEVGRYIMMRVRMPKQLDLKHAVVFGLGHGGMEAFSIVGLSYFMVYLTNSASMADAPVSTIYLAGIERIVAIFLQVCLSIFVMEAVRRNKFSWVIISILIHTAVNFITVILQSQGLSVYAVEGIFVLMSLAFGIFIYLRFIKNSREKLID